MSIQDGLVKQCLGLMVRVYICVQTHCMPIPEHVATVTAQNAQLTVTTRVDILRRK